MKINEDKAQSSMEFIITVAILLILFSILGIALYQKYIELSDLKVYITGRRMANTFADNINQITVVGEGYSQQFRVYTRYPGDEFNVTIYKNETTLAVEKEMTWYAPLLTRTVECYLNICEMDENKTTIFLNSTHTLEIINYNNTVYIGEVTT